VRPEFYSKNKFEKLVHLVSYIIRIYHDARSPERQNPKSGRHCEDLNIILLLRFGRIQRGVAGIYGQHKTCGDDNTVLACT